MLTMEFEELRQLWTAQDARPIYVLDQDALHRRILSKKKQAGHFANISEKLLLAVNLGSTILVTVINAHNKKINISMYAMAAWMLITAIYVLMHRVSRRKENSRYDRSMRGDLDHAFSMASYQVRLSQIMRWNIPVLAVFCLLGMGEAGKPVWIMGLILFFFMLSMTATRWEHAVYKRRKKELQLLRAKLQEFAAANDDNKDREP